MHLRVIYVWSSFAVISVESFCSWCSWRNKDVCQVPYYMSKSFWLWYAAFNRGLVSSWRLCCRTGSHCKPIGQELLLTSCIPSVSSMHIRHLDGGTMAGTFGTLLTPGFVYRLVEEFYQPFAFQVFEQHYLSAVCLLLHSIGLNCMLIAAWSVQCIDRYALSLVTFYICTSD